MTSPVPCRREEGRSRSRTGTKACVRCRQKKKRCDQKLPRCRPCELAGVECYGFEPAARRQVPRGYVRSLEDRVAYLEAKLRGAGAEDHDLASPQPPHAPTSPFAPSESASLESLLDAATTSPGIGSIQGGANAAARDTLGTIHALSQRQPKVEAEFSKILLHDLMNSRPSHQLPRGQQDQADKPATDIVSNIDTGPITIPREEVARNLVNEFFTCANYGLPLLHEPTLALKLAQVYDMPRKINLAETHTTAKSRMSVFFVLEVFAIALLTMQKREPSRIPTWLADRYHKGALEALTEVGLQNDIEGVQALLLIGQFYYFHPTLWSIWNTIGAALHLAVELGLHQDPPPSDEPDALTLDNRRRAFWVAYAMERNIAISKGKPTCLSDGAIDVKFPSVVVDSLILPEGIPTTERQVSGPKIISIHFFKYRQIQSEMRQVLFERPSPPYSPINLEQWQQQTRDRLKEWYQTVPPCDKMNKHDKAVVETLELTYHTALAFLHRPSPNNPSPAEAQLLVMAQSSIKLIQLYRKFFLEKKLTIYWQAVDTVYSAGTALMYAYVNSTELRERVAFRSFESTIHLCSSVLWGMVERFPVFQYKRDAFDVAVSSVLADLSSSETDSIEKLILTRSTPEQNQYPWISSQATENESTLDTQLFPSDIMDSGDLAMIWEATIDLSGTTAPMWL